MIRTIGAALCVALVGGGAHAADIRRVVTGLDANDKAVAQFDSRVPLVAGASGVPGANLWTTEGLPPGFSFKDDAALKQKGLSPPDNGTTLRVVDFPPLDEAATAKMNPTHMMNVVGDHAPKRGVAVTHPMMHRTRTVDYAVVLSGEIDMMLDGATLHMKAGDIIVQQATNHAWINRSKEPARVLFVLMDSKNP